MRRRNAPSEPSRRDLRSIEAEWPQIERELAVVDAECRAAAGDELAARRAARAARQAQRFTYAPDGAA
ncbi:hypothetical protein ACIB24_04210 [Spongisporangium articulatum]|uniref:Uncharacterized protein n=1 Tax=Spongisporangium articulatum TaxID=3362603 RepID=A0ABW8AIS4_9ACTN